MATDMNYYSGVVPTNFTATFYDYINEWYDINLDNQMARKCTVVTQVPDTTENYEINKIDYTSDDVIPSSKRTPGVEVTIGSHSEQTPLWRWAEYFVMNEDDLAKDPMLQRRYIEGCMSKIYRGEDKVWFAGRTVNNITGVDTAAGANSNGKVVASGASGADTNNIGAWLTSDTNRDIYEDLRVARGKLDSKYRTNLKNLFLIGSAASMDAFWQKDPYSDNSEPIYRSVGPLFGRTPDDTSWMVTNDQVTSGYVYIVTKNREAAELIQARGVTIDDNYPRKPIKNFEVHLYQDVGISFHDNNAFVEVAIT
jgi:hypothetical protein